MDNIFESNKKTISQQRINKKKDNNIYKLRKTKRKYMNKIKRYFKFTFLFIIIILTISLVSAGLFNDLFKKLTITGKAQQADVGLNITVTSGTEPVIVDIYNGSMTDVSSGTNEGPSATYVTIKFAVEDADGIGHLNNETAKIKFSKTNEATRTNAS